MGNWFLLVISIAALLGFSAAWVHHNGYTKAKQECTTENNKRIEKENADRETERTRVDVSQQKKKKRVAYDIQWHENEKRKHVKKPVAVLLCMVLLFLQAGCASYEPRNYSVSASLRSECAEIVPFAEGEHVTMGTMMEKLVETTNMYHECKARQKALVGACGG